MSSINYNDVQKRFFMKAEAHDFVATRLPKEHIEAKLCTWLHSSIAKPHIRKLFKTVSLNDDEKIISYDMAHSIDDESDKEFILEILGSNLLLCWVTQHNNRHTNMINLIGTNAEKFYSPAEFMKAMDAKQSSIQAEIQNMIAERSGSFNSYLHGN